MARIYYLLAAMLFIFSVFSFIHGEKDFAVIYMTLTGLVLRTAAGMES